MNFDAIDMQCAQATRPDIVDSLKSPHQTPTSLQNIQVFNQSEKKSLTTAIVWFIVAFGIANMAMFVLMLT